MFSRVSMGVLPMFMLVAGALATGCAGSASEDSGSSEGAASASLARGYEGTIGTLKVALRLGTQGSTVTGSYFYSDKTGTGDTLTLSGTVTNGKLSLTEKVNGAGAATGTFEGTITATGITGTWKNASGATKLPLSLKPITAPKAITRKYKATQKTNDTQYGRDCSLEAEAIEVYGLADAKAEAAIGDALKIAPLDKDASGNCSSDIRTVTQSVSFQASGFLTVHASTEWDGGAYPEVTSDYFNFELASGKNLKGGDLFPAASSPKLKALVAAQINADPQLDADNKKEQLDEFDSHWSDDTDLSGIAMGFGANGLAIDMLNNYPHAVAALAPSVEIPWASVKPLLVAGSPAAALAK